MHSWSFSGRGGYPRRFEEQYHCYSVAYADKPHLEKGDKILLPPSAFDTLARLQVDYPMLFRLSSPSKGTMTHSGVLEFTAEEGSCYIPFWMMQNLLIEEGTVISVTNVSLPKASFVKLQPQHVDFLEISNPRAVLEHALRNFSCVTKGDVICVPYNSKNYHFELKEVKPQDAACIIETDCNVDFDAPIGYKEPSSTTAASNTSNDHHTSATATGSSSNALANLPKQSAHGGEIKPSPKTDQEHQDSKPAGVRVVDGKILRPDDHNNNNNIPQTSMLADRTGGTGVQKNAAIPVKAPQIDYWAINAGDGARLDGKKPAILKDKDGTEVDIRQLRAEAAARRAKQTSGATSTSLRQMEQTNGADESADESAPANRRKTRVGSKYSRLKPSGKAFQGSANSMS